MIDQSIPKDDMMSPGQFHWFTGVVEEVKDPEERGRYRVRCFGYHTEKKDYIPTTSLPWAHVMMPITSGASCGVGESATGLLRGTWVVGFFRDGPTAQDPVIMGSLPSVSSKVDYGYGFTDPLKVYPLASKVGEQDIPEEAISKGGKYRRSFSYDMKDKLRMLTPVSIALDGVWKLPPIASIIKVEYPKNHVRAYERTTPNVAVYDPISDSTGILNKDVIKKEEFEASAGMNPFKSMHVAEFDVTPGWERISTMHKSGTYKEWTPKGDETVVIVGDEYRIIVKNQMISIKGDCTLTVDGNYHRKVMGSEFVEVMGNRTEIIMGNKTQTVYGSNTRTVLGNTSFATAGQLQDMVMGNRLLTTLGNVGETSAKKAQLILGAHNTIALGDHTINAVGRRTATSIGDMMTGTMGNSVTSVLKSRTTQIVLDDDLSVLGAMKYQSGIDATFGGTNTEIGGAGRLNLTSPMTTINNRWPICLPL